MIFKILIFFTIFIFIFTYLLYADDKIFKHKDKISHFLVSFILGAAIHTSINKNINCTEDESAALTFLTTIGIGTVKESIDVKFSITDLEADIAGAALAASLKF